MELSQKRKLLLVSSADVRYINQEMMKARDSMKPCLLAEEILKAENAIIKFCLREIFHSEICTPVAGIPVKKKCSI